MFASQAYKLTKTVDINVFLIFLGCLSQQIVWIYSRRVQHEVGIKATRQHFLRMSCPAIKDWWGILRLVLSNPEKLLNDKTQVQRSSYFAATIHIFTIQCKLGDMPYPGQLFTVKEKSRIFQNDIPCLLSLKTYPTAEQTAHKVGIQLTSRYLQEEKGGRVAVKLVCKRLTLVVLSVQANRQKAMGCYLGGAGLRVWEDSMSRAIQNATDQVTGPVNIADAYDLDRSLNTQWNSNLLLKD